MLIFDLNSISKTDINMRYSLAQMVNISVSIYCSVISFRLRYYCYKCVMTNYPHVWGRGRFKYSAQQYF